MRFQRSCWRLNWTGGLHPCPAGVSKKFTDTMLDILVYLYESFRMAELAPDRDALEKRLFAAGFEEADINAALDWYRSEEHTSELQSHLNLVCRLLLEKKNKDAQHVSIDRTITGDVCRC